MNERLSKERVWRLGLSPVQFAAKAGISMPTVYKLFNGKNVNDETRYKARRALEELEKASNRDSHLQHKAV